MKITLAKLGKLEMEAGPHKYTDRGLTSIWNPDRFPTDLCFSSQFHSPKTGPKKIDFLGKTFRNFEKVLVAEGGASQC